jgi:FixJ family two-component response regulator
MAATETAKQLENEAVAQRNADEKKERKQLNIRRMKRLLERPKNRLEKLVRQQRNKQVRCVS